MLNPKPHKPVYTVERTREGGWFVSRTFVSGSSLWVWRGTKLFLVSHNRKTSFAQLVPIEALPVWVYAPELGSRVYGKSGDFEIIVRWLPGDVKNPHPIGASTDWDGLEALQSVEEARKRLDRG
jgi:hypothetical protein